jgi:elongator complex protein 3
MDLAQYYSKNLIPLKNIIAQACKLSSPSDAAISRILGSNPDVKGKVLSKGEVIAGYRYLSEQGKLRVSQEVESRFLENMKMKRVRTLSGVTTVTVLTKPFPCPGKCIFCPTDVKMPKSYVASEPGAQRALANGFDPYLQTYNRLVALRNIGHPTEKVELIVLGGTWTAYPLNYRLWFIKRCFDALNDFGSSKMLAHGDAVKIKQNKTTWEDLEKSQETNIESKCKCVGLSVETRPDEITPKSVLEIRRLGATKVQIGVQTLDDRLLRLNGRAHTVTQIKNAFKLLRQAGFKIQAHWMPNLYGSNPGLDLLNYKKLFTKDFSPDELKMYPCSLLKKTPLETLYQQGKWRPYTEPELLDLLTKLVAATPAYCRITRMIRDIPSQEITAGNKKTNFRQLVDANVTKLGLKVSEIRSREIGDTRVSFKDLTVKIVSYPTTGSLEYFLQFVTKQNQIAGFLRLSLPTHHSYIPELEDAAIIREVHVYGQSLHVGETANGKAQHSGLGTLLIIKAKEIAWKAGYKKLAVISAIGTISYYKKFGFERGDLYQLLNKDVQEPTHNRKNNTK